MKKRLLSMLASVIFVMPLLFCFGNSQGSTAYAAGSLKVLPTDVSTPSSGCTFLGIEGEYIAQIQDALDLINKIRKEACDEGVIDPSTGKPLTPSDYVPIQWSGDLEYIARLRAAEASLTIDHARTNGDFIWFTSPNGIQSWAEVLAWNWSRTMTQGIDQWYSEKKDWVNKTPGAVTGHYTSMIDPSNRYVGLATFCSDITPYYNTTAGEFSSSSVDSTRGTSTGTIIQTLEVKNSYISYELSCPDKIKNSDKVSITATVSFTDYWGDAVTTKGLVLTNDTASKIKWSSSNSNIAVSNGTITIKSCGKADITATFPDGTKKTKTVSAEHSYKSAVTKAATCTANGVKTYTCSVCKNTYTEAIKATGHKYAWTTDKAATCTSEGVKTQYCTVCKAKGDTASIPKTEHKFGAYVVKQKPTTTKEGIEERTCSACGAKEQRTIAKLSAQTSATTASTSKTPSTSKTQSTSKTPSTSSSPSTSSKPDSSSATDESQSSESTSNTDSTPDESLPEESTPTVTTPAESSSAEETSVDSSSAIDSSSSESESSDASSDSSSEQTISGSSQSNNDKKNIPLIVGICSGGVLVAGIIVIVIKKIR